MWSFPSIYYASRYSIDNSHLYFIIWFDLLGKVREMLTDLCSSLCVLIFLGNLNEGCNPTSSHPLRESRIDELHVYLTFVNLIKDYSKHTWTKSINPCHGEWCSLMGTFPFLVSILSRSSIFLGLMLWAWKDSHSSSFNECIAKLYPRLFDM